jgi:uncharacterized protein Veg
MSQKVLKNIKRYIRKVGGEKAMYVNLKKEYGRKNKKEKTEFNQRIK